MTETLYLISQIWEVRKLSVSSCWRPLLFFGTARAQRSLCYYESGRYQSIRVDKVPWSNAVSWIHPYIFWLTSLTISLLCDMLSGVWRPRKVSLWQLEIMNVVTQTLYKIFEGRIISTGLSKYCHFSPFFFSFLERDFFVFACNPSDCSFISGWWLLTCAASPTVVTKAVYFLRHYETRH